MHHYTLVALAALLLSAPAIAAQDGSGRRPPVPEAIRATSCGQTFSSSSAGQTCILKSASFHNGVCTIGAICGRGADTAVWANYTGPISRVSGLHNCLGVLKYGGC